MSATRPQAIRIHESDNVAVALQPLAAGMRIELAGTDPVVLAEDVAAGHKFALAPLADGATVVKYGFPIGRTTADVAVGGWVHSHNLRTALEGEVVYDASRVGRGGGGSGVGGRGTGKTTATSDERKSVRSPDTRPQSPDAVPTFRGYRRADGRAATRNEIWVLNTVGCVNFAAEAIARASNEKYAGVIDGVYAFGHPFGCSQLGDDLLNTQRVLAGLMRNPNAGGVLLLGLGCENNQMDQLLALAGPGVDRSRLRYFNTQDVLDEREQGLTAIEELVAQMREDRRVAIPASELVIGHKCGGSDGFSGISANALVGRIADRLTDMGGGVVLTEVPEMFGAEQVLMDRAASREEFDRLVQMINDFKQYFIKHDQPIYENPSPGNKAGGLTTLEEKSLGAIQKGGRATVRHVLRYGEPAPTGGLSLLEAPGNDGISSTAMVASGATMLLFTTGRGTPLGFPVPTVKISSNSAIAEKKPHWIDFNAGQLLDGTRSMDELTDDLFDRILRIASGDERTNNERNGYREIAIWKSGVTL